MTDFMGLTAEEINRMSAAFPLCAMPDTVVAWRQWFDEGNNAPGVKLATSYLALYRAHAKLLAASPAPVPTQEPAKAVLGEDEYGCLAFVAQPSPERRPSECNCDDVLLDAPCPIHAPAAPPQAWTRAEFLRAAEWCFHNGDWQLASKFRLHAATLPASARDEKESKLKKTAFDESEENR